jgi:cell shape-determining protein MreD
MLFALVTFIAGIIIAVAESTFLNSVTIAGIRPDVAVLVAAVATCRTDFRRAMILAITIGLARDFVSGGAVMMAPGLVWGTVNGVAGGFGAIGQQGVPHGIEPGGVVGMTVLSMIVMTYVLFVAQDYLLTYNWRSQCVMVFIGFMSFAVTFVTLKVVLGFEIGPPLQVLERVVLSACYTSLLAPWAFMMTRKPDVPSYLRLKRKYSSEHETIPEAKV